MPQRSAAWQRAGIALAGVGVLAGYLLASGAAAPLVEDLVAAVDPADAAAADADTGAAPQGRTVNGKRVALSDATTDWMSYDKRPEWGSERLVPQGPTGSDAAQAPQRPSVPLIQVPENPKGRVFFNPAPEMHRYELRPPPDCPQPSGPGLTVMNLRASSTKKGSATVTWWDLNDPNNTGYELVALLVRTGKVTTQAVEAPGTCIDVTVEMTGLVSGEAYVIYLSELAVSPEQDNRAYRISRGQTRTIVIA